MCLTSRTLPEIEPRLGLYLRCHIREWAATDISEYITANFLVNFIIDGIGVKPRDRWNMRHSTSALKLLHKELQ